MTYIKKPVFLCISEVTDEIRVAISAPQIDLETCAILKKTASAHRYLAELKGLSATIPNQEILINNLFYHPYTKIDFLERDLNVSRLTATKYLDTLADGGFLKKEKIGRSNYYVNTALFRILTGE